MIQAIRSRLLWALSAAVVLSTLAACGARSTQTPPLVVRGTEYAASPTLPARYEKVEGVAMYDASAELAGLMASLPSPPPASNSFFILLNPRKPIEGILVCAGPNLEAGVIQAQPSNRVKVTGNLKTMADTTVATYVQEQFGVSLARDSKGATAWIDNELALKLVPVPPASPAAAPASPAAASPAAQRPVDGTASPSGTNQPAVQGGR